MSMESQPAVTAIDLGLPVVSNNVYTLYGVAATNLVRPDSDDKYAGLYLHVVSGNFQARIGQFDGNDGTDLLTYAAIASSIDDGTAKLLFVEGERLGIMSPANMTFVGDSATALLTYWWV